MRARYQKGWLELVTLAGGRKVWKYRWREYAADGSCTKPELEVGTLKQYPTKAAAWKRADTLRATVTNNPKENTTLFADVIDRYVQEEMPERFSTRHGYSSYIKNYIRPRWGEGDIAAVEPYAVEGWLKSLDLAGKTRGQIKGVMSVIFECAMRWKMVPIGRNPMSLVRVKGGSKRREKPRVLTLEEFERLLAELQKEPFRTMVIAAICLGLRVSELFALKWMDFNWEELTLSVERGIVRGHVGELKTEASHQHLPLAPELAELFFRWKSTTEFSKPEHWVFASPFTAGEYPYLSMCVLDKRVKPAAKRAGLGNDIGWHTFRHTYATLLRDAGTEAKVQQELMRHADMRTTMNVYGSSVTETRREANAKVVRMVIPLGKRVAGGA